MTVASVETALSLLPFAILLVAVPLTYVLLLRLLDDIGFEGIAERESDARRELTYAHAADDANDERVRCRECGTENEPNYTFCRYCQARIGG